MSLNISVKNIEQHIAAMAKIGNLGEAFEAGFQRASWSDEETSAILYIKRTGEAHGLQATYDQVGNLYLSTPGDAIEVVQVGSHLDTVPQGGMYDGGAGILIGLEAILALKDKWESFHRRLELVIWRGEESATFDEMCKGSKAAFGICDPMILKNTYDGKTLEVAIREQGFDPSPIQLGQPALSQDHIDSIVAYFEVHIEQANKLEVDRNDIGVVSSIRGSRRLRVIVIGEAAHSGSTPMGPDYRSDATLAISYMLVKMDHMANQVLNLGQDLVQTAGIINSDPNFNLHHPQVSENAMTKVSPYGYFTLDIRSNNSKFLENYVSQAQNLIEEIAAKFKVGVTIQPICNLQPMETLDLTLQKLVIEACTKLNYPFQVMTSGALHDLVVVTRQLRHDGKPIPGALILIPCKEGISHNPKEYTSPNALQKGAMVLSSVMEKVAASCN